MTEAEWLTSEAPAAMLAYLSVGCPGVRHVSATDRKLRRFAVACCRAVWPLLTDDVPCERCEGRGSFTTGRPRSQNYDTVSCVYCGGTGRLNRSRRAVEVAERYADGEATEDVAITAWHAARAAHEQMLPRVRENAEQVNAAYNVSLLLCDLGTPAEIALWLTKEPAVILPAAQAALLREIVGNPFQPRYEFSDIEGEGHTWVVEFPIDVNRGSLYILPKRWLTPTVLALATAAYEERGGMIKKICPRCEGESVGKILGCPDCGNRGFLLVEDGSGHLHADRLGVLSDRLKEEGCDNEELLRHLRGQERCLTCLHSNKPGLVWWETTSNPGWRKCECAEGWRPLRSPHVRGCWVVDLLLGKE